MFSDSSGDEDDQNVKLTINEHYAKAFEYRKEREELEKLKEKYGSDFNESDLDESTDSESAESEDEEGEELTPAVDAAILRTLARIRKRDPAIYDSEKNIFGEEKEKVSEAPAPAKAKKQEKSKPITLRQQNLDAVLHGSRSPTPEPQPTHVQEQEALRSETIRAFHSAVPASDDEDDILVLREKTKDEVEKDEEEYRAYLERQVGEDLRGLVTVGEDGEEGDDEEDEGEKKDKKKKKKKGKKEREGKGKSKADEDQEFLLNYILNRGWIDAASQRVPTYHEITGDAKKKSKSKGKSKETPASSSASEDDENDPGLLSDASFDSLASQFETSYNHRFEEPDAAVIPSFPRQIESTVRREENPRKEARERKKARKEAEMEKKREEVRRLKALKVKEIRRRLERIGVESGLVKGSKGKGGEDGEGGVDVDGALQELDLEGEWDPEKHDRQLKELFAEEEEGEGGVEEDVRYDEDGKPVWDDEVDLGGIYVSEDEDEEVVERKSKKEKKKEKKLKKKKKDKGGEDEGEGVDVDAMDADVVGLGGEDDEEWDGTEEMRQRKWKEYMDSLYELDFNDLVGDMPTRFKYVPVSQVNYSLDPVDILMATDKELNEYMSVKKYAPYRHERGDRSKWDPKQQEKLRELKESLKKRQMAFGNYDANGAMGGSGANGSRIGSGKRGAEGAEEEGGEKPKKKRMGKKERLRLKAEEEAGGGAGGAGEAMEVEPVVGEEKKKKRKREEDAEVPVHAPEPESAAPTEEGTKKKKRKRKHKKAEGAAGDA